MSIYSVYVRNGISWILKPGDPSRVEFPEGSPLAGWVLHTPLFLPANVMGQGITYSVLGDGTILVLSDRIDFSTALTDADSALTIAQQILRWLRFSTGQARLGTDIVGHQIQADDVHQELLSLPTETRHRAHPMRHVEFSSLNFDTIRSALTENPTTTVPVYADVLLDAIEASFVSDVRKTILYAAVAVEVMASTRLDELFEKARSMPNSNLRIIEIEQAGGERVRKDPIFEELRKNAERNFKLLLNHLPLYVGGNSMLTDRQDLYRELLILHTTRNDLVHSGSVDEQDRMSLDHKGMRRAIEAAVGAFHWFGAAGRYVTLWNSELDAGWKAKDGIAGQVSTSTRPAQLGSLRSAADGTQAAG